MVFTIVEKGKNWWFKAFNANFFMKIHDGFTCFKLEVLW